MNTNNNSKNNKSVNTSGTSFYGSDDKGLKSMTTRFYNKCLVVGIHQPIPEDKQTSGGPKYDYKGGTLIYLTPKTSHTLAKIIKKDLDAIENGEEYKAKGVPSGANGLIEIAKGTKYGLESDRLTVAIYTVNEDKKASGVDLFQFKDDIVILDYDKSGSYEHEINCTDAEYFEEILNEFAKGMTNGYAHSIKSDCKWSIDKIVERQIQMLDALGVKNDSAVKYTSWSSSTPSTYSKPVNESANKLADEIESMYN